MDDAVGAEEDVADDGEGDGVGVSAGGSDGTDEALKCKTADRTSLRNLKRAAFSGLVDTAFSQWAKMQPRILETFGGAIGAA